MTTTNTRTRPDKPGGTVAIIGMGCRLPGGIDSPDLLWKTLTEGRDCVSPIPQERWERMVAHLHPDQIPEHPFSAGVVEHVFDHAFFGISADEAAEMDPQQGWLLEVAYEALADAALVPASLAGSRSGVYVGAASIDQAAENFGARNRAGVFTASGAGMAILANRVSHHLDLDGPSLTMDTACSSSLSALHYAVRDLRAGEVDLALVAGTNVLTNPVITASFVESGVLSPEGRCRPFDQRADGYVRSEGAVVLVLARAALAAERGHRVWAHVAGTGVGHGGASPHLLAPRRGRQAATLRRSLADAGLAPDQVGWVQAHGTGTKAGDRVEAAGIAEVFGHQGPVVVGSVKSALGHLEGAAGVTGVMAAALAVHHGQIPPTAGHQNLRKGLEKQVRVPARVEPWPEGDGSVRVAGVSSFGFGGSNAHALISQAPVTEPPVGEDPMPFPETVVVSAHSPTALSATAGHLAADAPAVGSVGVVADTCLARGAHGRVRAAVTAADLGTLVQGLRNLQDGTPDPYVIGPRTVPTVRPRVVFVYSGHGGHHPHAGAELMRLSAFATAVEEARATLSHHTGYPVWWPGDDLDGFVDAQHCTFLIQLGLTAVLAEHGIVPDLVLGHSVGEITAAYTAGVLNLNAATRVLAERSHLLGKLGETGGMLAIRADIDQVQAALTPYDGQVTVASYSAPAVQVVAGPSGYLNHLRARLEERGVWCRPVADVIPAHSPAVDPMVPALREALAGLISGAGRIPIISTARPDHPSDAPGRWGAGYWAEQARCPVRFTEALAAAAALDQDRSVVFVEIGPRALLSEHIHHTISPTTAVAITSDTAEFARGIGELYTAGLTPTRPTGRAHPHLVVRPGWDHSKHSSPSQQLDVVTTPAPDHVLAHLTEELGRLTPLLEGFDPHSTWTETGLDSQSLLHLLTRLRRVPPWAQVDIRLFLPDRTWQQVSTTLVEFLPRPQRLSQNGAASFLP
ncbi:type I polyketide synthase [Nocardiopsis sp. JB363]|uniref:type I polyketide synthase n=1 Tax=Nocardiopsis sp. JB363 TaxID=1434837 RepID=UPI00097B28C1|nr:type I polyketide synthase [Nocardiopsis sp. JB363]SIO89541.1 Malonyl CoA-acyl carrier protein transacylase [Nocardiopsis sp. JB363]